MPFCFLTQNFAEIGLLVDELWPKKRLSRWRPPPSWIFKNSIFGHVTVIGFNICCGVPNFIKIWRFFSEIWRLNNFQNGGRPPSWMSYDVTLMTGHIFVVQILSCNFMLIGFVVSEIVISHVAFLAVRNGPWQCWSCACTVSRESRVSRCHRSVIYR